MWFRENWTTLDRKCQPPIGGQISKRADRTTGIGCQQSSKFIVSQSRWSRGIYDFSIDLFISFRGIVSYWFLRQCERFFPFCSYRYILSSRYSRRRLGCELTMCHWQKRVFDKIGNAWRGVRWAHTPSKVQRGNEVIDSLCRVENDFTTCSHFQVSSSLSLFFSLRSLLSLSISLEPLLLSTPKCRVTWSLADGLL